MIKTRLKRYGAQFSIALIFVTMLAATVSCSKSESYSEMLRDEEKAVNWWLANHRVEASVPADSVFEIGEDAPFYKMDEDGYVYMQVINPGTDVRPVKNDRVYFRYMRANIRAMYEGGTVSWTGNSDNMDMSPTSLIFGNYDLTSTSQWGEGIQVPLQYLGYDCEVNLVLKSYNGFTSDQSQCIPYVVNVRYFKAIY